MTWSDLLKKGAVKHHQTNPNEITSMRALVDRDLKDANITALSIDRRYATAYSAALNLARLSVAVTGYRVTSAAGHHVTSFQAARLALGPESQPFIDFFDICRRKRNKVDYDLVDVATQTELDQLIEQVLRFAIVVHSYINKDQSP